MGNPRLDLDPLLHLTIGQAAGGYVYIANCTQCKSARKLDLDGLGNLLGPNFPIRDLRKRLRCSNPSCGARQPIIAFLTRDYYQLHSVKYPDAALTIPSSVLAG